MSDCGARRETECGSASLERVTVPLLLGDVLANLSCNCPALLAFALPFCTSEKCC